MMKVLCGFCGVALMGLVCFGANSNSVEAAAPTNKVIVSKNHDKAKWTLVEDLRFTNGLDRTLWTQFAYHPWQMKRPPSIITNDNLAYAAGGLLHLNAELNPKIDETYSYMGRGGRLWTRGKLNLHYGKVEIKARIDDQKGGAVAFWMMPEARGVKWPLCGEIDIIEKLNCGHKVYQTPHSYRIDKEGKLESPHWHGVPAVETRDWNVYGFEWYPDELVWTVNGKVTHRYPKISDRKEDWPWTEPNYLRLEIMAENAVGTWVGPLDPSTLPFECRIESIKLYTGEMDGKPFGKVIWLDGRKGK